MPLLCYHVFCLSCVTVQSYTEAGQPGATCNTPHSPSVQGLHSSSPLLSKHGSLEGTCLCHRDVKKRRLWWVEVCKCIAEPGAPLCRGAADSTFLLSKREADSCKGRLYLRNFLTKFQNLMYSHFIREVVSEEKSGWSRLLSQ